MKIGYVDRPGSEISHLFECQASTPHTVFEKIVSERVMIPPDEEGAVYLVRCVLSWVYLGLDTPNDPVFSFRLWGGPEDPFCELSEFDTEELAWQELIAVCGYSMYSYTETQPEKNFDQLELGLVWPAVTASPQPYTLQTKAGS